MAFRWTIKDADGNAIRDTEPFDSKEDAEAWMGTGWSDLVNEGADRVVLMDDDSVVYDMSLQAG